ncbi:MAG TPA: DUF362 domain-containing protein [Thermodesulfobacteriota bacterium]|nr:DUF362 domain-containing protein [Thermodesulfobacteriota bacterium]
METKVAIKRCDDYDEEKVYAAVKEAVALLGGISKFVGKDDLILLKPNLLAGRPPEAAVTTHPSVVKAAIRLVKDAGGTPVVGDSPGIGNAGKIAGKCGVLAVCESMGVPFVDLKTLTIAENPDGHTFKRLEVAKEAVEVDGIINLPKLKTHAQMVLTLGVKNLFGCVPGKLKPQWHLSAGVRSSHFAGMLLDLYAFLNPRLTIMDGIVGMEGNGPGSGDPRKLGLVLASSNAVAMDTVIAGFLGVKTSDVPILKEAQRRGLAGSDPGRVTTLGESIDSVRVKGFRLPPVSDTNFASRFPYFIDKRLRKALTARPHISNSDCTLCSVCVEVCPAEVMTRTDRIKIDYDRCIRCYCCQEMCPEGAIEPKSGWLKRLVPGL